MIKKIGCVQHDCAECVAREQDLVEKLKSAALQSYAICYKDAQSGDKRPWVGLTGQEKASVASVSLDVHDAVHRTEAKLKEKNT